ncbi:MAG: M3 family metallopeptidase, partial [Candidatus Pacearchaeota archaeon]
YGLMSTRNNKLRKELSEAFDTIVLRYLDIAVIELNSILENKKIDDNLRKFPRPDSSRHLEDDIDTEIIDSLVKAVASNFYISCRFHNLKAKILGMKKFKYNDRKIEFAYIDKEYDYDSSIKLVKKVFSNLDKEFLEIYNVFIKNRQIDVLPRKGKRGGAFCINISKSHPTYIMLNHTGKLNDVLTIAHEVGHGINSELMRKKQNSLNFCTPKSTAEVASTFIEDFVLQEILKEANDEQKFSLMMTKLQDDVQTIFRQIACYKFEQDIHIEYRKKGHLSKEDIGKLFEKNMFAYLGNSFEKSDSMKSGWVYWPHIRDYFYVYSYASGLLISKYLQKKVKENNNFINKVKEFLSTGTSKSPKEIFLELGIDITKESFWISGLKEIENYLNDAEELAKKLGKI